MNLRTVSYQEHRCLIKEFKKALNSKFNFPEQVSKLLSKEPKSFWRYWFFVGFDFPFIALKTIVFIKRPVISQEAS